MVKDIIVARNVVINSDLLSLLPHTKVHEASVHQLRDLSSFQTGAELIAICSYNEHPLEHLTKARRLIYLDDVQDPGNVGTIIRLADWYGLDAVVRSPGSADFYNPKTVQSTMGSIASCLLYTAAPKEVLGLTKVPIMVSSLSGSSKPPKIDLSSFCLVIGNESTGIQDFWFQNFDHNYLIAGASTRKADSLNAAISCAILLDRLSLVTNLRTT